MLKTIFTAATLTTALTGFAYADGSGGHSHPHVHPHTGHHSTTGTVDPNMQHSHGNSAVGETHTHDVNGVTVRHTHSSQLTDRYTFVDRWDDKLVAREQRYLGRRQVGAGFGPYSLAEWNARARAGQPGLYSVQEPWPRRSYRSR